MWGCLDGAPGDVAVATAASHCRLCRGPRWASTLWQRFCCGPEAGERRAESRLRPFLRIYFGRDTEYTGGVARGAPVASLLEQAWRGQARAVAVGAGQVVAIADGGNQLIALRGGRSETLGAYPDHHFVAAAMHGVANELWLLEGDGNITTVDPDSGDMSRRYLPYTPWLLAKAAAPSGSLLPMG